VQLGDGPVRVLWGVNASEPRQLFGGKTLRAEGHAIDASGAIFIEAAALDCARIGLERDLGLAAERELGGNRLEQPLDRRRCDQAGCAAAKEYAGDHPLLGSAGLCGQILDQRLNVGGFGERPVQRMGIEIAIRALAHAPGKMHIKPERWQLEGSHGNATGRCRHGERAALLSVRNDIR
jgi:hypothetical protein